MATSKYAQPQVAKMIINPYCGDVLSEYPRLKEVIGNTDTKHITQQIAFLSWVYDFNSPAVRDFSDINKRKEWARLETEIIKDPSYELAVSFLTKVVKSRTWTLICSLESTFTEYAERVAKRIEDSENGKEIDILKAVEIKNKMLNQMADMSNSIDELYGKLFSNDQDLIEEHNRKTMFTPEAMSKLTKKNV